MGVSREIQEAIEWFDIHGKNVNCPNRIKERRTFNLRGSNTFESLDLVFLNFC